MSGAYLNVMSAAMLQDSDDTTSPLHYPGVMDAMYGQAMQVCCASRPRVIRTDTHYSPAAQGHRSTPHASRPIHNDGMHARHGKSAFADPEKERGGGNMKADVDDAGAP